MVDSSMAKEQPSLGLTALEDFAPVCSLFPREEPMLSLPCSLGGLILRAPRYEASCNGRYLSQQGWKCPFQRTRCL